MWVYPLCHKSPTNKTESDVCTNFLRSQSCSQPIFEEDKRSAVNVAVERVLKRKALMKQCPAHYRCAAQKATWGGCWPTCLVGVRSSTKFASAATCASCRLVLHSQNSTTTPMNYGRFRRGELASTWCWMRTAQWGPRTLHARCEDWLAWEMMCEVPYLPLASSRTEHCLVSFRSECDAWNIGGPMFAALTRSTKSRKWEKAPCVIETVFSLTERISSYSLNFSGHL